MVLIGRHSIICTVTASFYSGEIKHLSSFSLKVNKIDDWRGTFEIAHIMFHPICFVRWNEHLCCKVSFWTFTDRLRLLIFRRFFVVYSRSTWSSFRKFLTTTEVGIWKYWIASKFWFFSCVEIYCIRAYSPWCTVNEIYVTWWSI